jgi:hypothetical protein
LTAFFIPAPTTPAAVSRSGNGAKLALDNRPALKNKQQGND